MGAQLYDDSSIINTETSPQTNKLSLRLVASDESNRLNALASVRTVMAANVRFHIIKEKHPVAYCTRAQQSILVTDILKPLIPLGLIIRFPFYFHAFMLICLST